MTYKEQLNACTPGILPYHPKTLDSQRRAPAVYAGKWHFSFHMQCTDLAEP